MVDDPNSPGSRNWKYPPLRSAEEGREWATRTLQVHDDFDNISDDVFALRLNTSQVVNEVSPGRKQYFACHLLLRNTLPHSFFMHGTHAIFDARPLMYAFRRFFQLVAASGKADPLEKFVWGTESSNLVADIVTVLHDASGPPLNDGVDHDLQLPERLRMTKVRPRHWVNTSKTDMVLPSLPSDCRPSEVNTTSRILNSGLGPLLMKRRRPGSSSESKPAI